MARHLLHVFPTFAVGGAQVRFARIAAHLGDRARHTVIGLNGDYACAEKIASDLAVEYVEPPVPPHRTLRELGKVRRCIRQAAPDLLVTYNWGAAEWALANALWPIAPHVHFEDGFGPEEADRQLPRRVWFRRVALCRTRTLVVPSLTLQRIATEVWKQPVSRVRYVPNGIDVSRFEGPGDAMLLPPADLRIGTVAALRAEKNLGRLLRAFAVAHKAISTARLAIVGDGPARPDLERLAAELGIAQAVDFPGHVAQPETVYPLFDVFALSSDTEQMPLSVLEAMAAAKPVASVDVGDVAAMVADDNRRFVVPKGDEAGLAQALVALLRDAGLRQRLGAANRQAAIDKYPPAAMFETYERVLLS
jgi:glycosyltransferase involved in cell wall biosynthesis